MANWDSDFNGGPNGANTRLSAVDTEIQYTRGRTQERMVREHSWSTTSETPLHGEHKLGSARAYYIINDVDPTLKPDGATPLTASEDKGRLAVFDNDDGTYNLKVKTDTDADEWVEVEHSEMAGTADNETITGEWDFSVHLPTVPTADPTEDDEVVSKAHLDSNRQAMVGMIAAFGAAPPSSKYAAWLQCNGQTITAATYPELHDYLTTDQPFGGSAESPQVPDIPEGAFLMTYEDGSLGAAAPSTTLTSGGVVTAEWLVDHDHGDISSEGAHAHAGQTTDSGTASIGNESSHYHLLAKGGDEESTPMNGTNYANGDYYIATNGDADTDNDKYQLAALNSTPDLARSGAGTAHTHTDSGHTHGLDVSEGGTHDHTIADEADGSNSRSYTRPRHVTVTWYIFAGKDAS